MRVVKDRDGGIVRRVVLLDGAGVEVAPVTRFLAHLTDHLAPEFAPPKVRAVIERFLRLHLQANLDRPQTVRHFRDALRRLVTWMAAAHPEMTSLAGLHRERECDLALTCSKFLTTSDYTPRLRARLHVEQQLTDDATARGWNREVERHQATRQRLLQLLEQLGESETR